MLDPFVLWQADLIKHSSRNGIGNQHAIGKAIENTRLGILVVIHCYDWDLEPLCRCHHRTRSVTKGDGDIQARASDLSCQLRCADKQASQLVQLLSAIMGTDDAVGSGQSMEVQQINSLCMVTCSNKHGNTVFPKVFDDGSKQRDMWRIIQIDP